MSENITFKKNDVDISVKEVDYIKYSKTESLHASMLTLKFSGTDFNIKMVNTLKRVASNRIPAYAFPVELIHIEENTTVAFNNDYMRLRLSTLPALGMDPDLCYLDEKYWYKVNFSDNTREKHKNEQQNEFYIDFTNNTSDIVSVTTNDIIVHIDGKQQNCYGQKYPILLLKARPGDTFKCHMKSVLGIGDLHANWKGTRCGYYDEIETPKGNEYLLTVEGNWQYSEYDALIRSCRYIIHEVTRIKKYIESLANEKKIKEDKMIFFTIPNEDHTLGELLNYEFQNHPKIIGSGVTKQDHLIKAILFKVQCISSEKYPVPAMLECIDICIIKISHCGKLIEELAKVNDHKKEDEPVKKVKKSK